MEYTEKKVWSMVFDAYETEVKMTGDIQEYAMNFLKIFNNVKSNRELLRVRNDYHDKVYLTWVDLKEENVREWLSQFGEVGETHKVLVFNVVDEAVEYDYDFDIYWDSVVVSETNL